ncbi:hypothetical protein BU26DRAFT_561421 [Trematosphaeria pertusa]|uniref:Uncharacterized protein n=1 Tax=Trematosphaeria pertusa TaxID=390896 RepID=A0A6A6IMZ3_9PLEO|nr:uncharacterized protein BU26DRAFT_561421 [Trematosphaeria pertusa]KAF2251607.1 hypothetical protein BU26DRAFT_561421 [Trematosphaeria pertusa]
MATNSDSRPMAAASLTSNIMQAVLQLIILVMFYCNRRRYAGSQEREVAAG